jgi:hypothetical protein
MNRDSECVVRGLPWGGVNPFRESGRFSTKHHNNRVAGIRVNKKRRPIWPPFFKEEERRGVKRNRFCTLIDYRSLI